MAKAMFGAGCFWGIEAAFRQVPGVGDVAVGYAGGTSDQPSYEDICTGTTGHAEVVEVDFDETNLSFETLLEVFWECHDPTQINRQGPDIGTQYRSVIFARDQAQHDQAIASKQARDASDLHGRPIATEISGAAKFWRAEDYHQRYFAKRGLAACPAHSANR